MRTVLLDGDTLVFEAAAAHEYEAAWEWDLWTLHADIVPAIHHLESAILEIQEGLKADRLVIALSDEARWRPAIMPSYKNKRVKTRKPIIYRPLRDFVHETYETFQRPMLEGDDVLGILATHPTLIKGEKIVVSIDKDMQTIPGLHLNYKKARESGDWEGNIRSVSAHEADHFHLFQTLTGDTTDNYPGCPGIGPVLAAKLLAPLWGHSNTGPFFSAEVAWPTVVAAYEKAGLNEAVALQNAQVARICRHTDYNFKTKEVIPWTPPVATAASATCPRAVTPPEDAPTSPAPKKRGSSAKGSCSAIGTP